MCKTPHGKLFIASGNRCLFALKACADELQKEEEIQCVEVNTLLISLSDTHLFPQSLFARCVEAFTGQGREKGCGPLSNVGLPRTTRVPGHQCSRAIGGNTYFIGPKLHEVLLVDTFGGDD